MFMPRNHVVRWLLVASLLFAAVLPALARKPNVVLILADDLGYGDLGCYGQTRIKTPNIDRLAREGLRFTQFYAGSPVCAASRATLFTGRHTGHNTIRGNGKVPLAAGDYTLSQMFRAVGYRVDGIGKWGLGLANTTGEPKAKGFTQWAGFLDQTEAHNYYPDSIWRYDSAQNWNAPVQNHGRRYIQDVFAEAMSRSLQINSDYQFFLYLPFTIPHANPALKKEGMQVPHDAPYSAEVWPQPEKNKAAMITRLDATVGQLLARLEQLRLHRDTIVIFTSDNGPHDKGGVDPQFFKSSGPLRGLKRDLYEGGIRVPMIVWWPGQVAEGKVSDQLWAMWDLMPTLAEVSGAKAPAGLDGISMLPTWLGQQQTNQHDHLYWEFHERGFQQAVRMGDWKGLRLKPGEPLELYNLKSDMAEAKDVAGQNPDVVTKLEEIMRTDRSESEEWSTDPARRKAPATDEDAEPVSPAPNSNASPPGTP
jgi:arylsulfatase A-like enzyme